MASGSNTIPGAFIHFLMSRSGKVSDRFVQLCAAHRADGAKHNFNLTDGLFSGRTAGSLVSSFVLPTTIPPIHPPSPRCPVTRRLAAVLTVVFAAVTLAADPPTSAKVDVGQPAPAFKIKDPTGKVIDLAELTAKGPVLVRLTCGCSGCDKELAYFQKIDEAYKGQGLVSLYVFKEPDEKMAKYAAEKKLEVLCAVDPRGLGHPQTKAMPTQPDREGWQDRRHRVQFWKTG